ncbi:hypothetical protein NVIE_0169 [Nitrososphaera viennensis EN76]|uniref:Uncharacterized protein n=1 Tax=Nitrososphaera viennensis EN76 TaxID=926571 RepID=A0A060HL85_9ARCH|nr:hypothetical protein NVIE_0169 [Nitrososphaera viennensis EN76]
MTPQKYAIFGIWRVLAHESKEYEHVNEFTDARGENPRNHKQNNARNNG